MVGSEVFYGTRCATKLGSHATQEGPDFSAEILGALLS